MTGEKKRRPRRGNVEGGKAEMAGAIVNSYSLYCITPRANTQGDKHEEVLRNGSRLLFCQ